MTNDETPNDEGIRKSEARRASEVVTRFPHSRALKLRISTFGRRPPVNVAWGIAPGRLKDRVLLAKGHVHTTYATDDYGLRPNTTNCLRFLGRCPVIYT